MLKKRCIVKIDSQILQAKDKKKTTHKTFDYCVSLRK